MITLEQAVAGKDVLVNGKTTTILTGHYEDAELGLMIKSSLFPGGYPASKHYLIGQQEAEVTDAVLAAQETLPAIIFEGMVLEETEPVKLTPELIRSKSKDLLTLTIKDMFDEAGLKKVKSAKMKLVKTRTSIQQIETVEKKKIKERHTAELKELTDYAASLYAACQEGENILQAKITAHENEKAEAQRKLDEERKSKTDGRNAKMYELGMMFNGVSFSNYGKTIDQEVLHAMADEKYADLLVEIEAMQMEYQVTGKEPEAKIMIPSGNGNIGAPAVGYGLGSPSVGYSIASKPKRAFATAVYERDIPGTDMRIVITKGTIEDLTGLVISNDRILESAYYVQTVKD